MPLNFNRDFYCIDKEHPLYGKRVQIETTIQIEDGSVLFKDAETQLPVDLKPNQVSPNPPK